MITSNAAWHCDFGAVGNGSAAIVQKRTDVTSVLYRLHFNWLAEREAASFLSRVLLYYCLLLSVCPACCIYFLLYIFSVSVINAITVV
jgi:hypothetical protein